MSEGRCSACNRLIYDTEKLDELPDNLICQHCGTINVIREPKLEVHKPEKLAGRVKPKKRRGKHGCRKIRDKRN